MNIAAPPSLNLLREIGLFMCLLKWRKFRYILIFWLGIIVGGYCLYLFSYSQHGKRNLIYSFWVRNCREHLIIFFH